MWTRYDSSGPGGPTALYATKNLERLWAFFGSACKPHYMEPEILRSTGALALGASVPSLLMVWWAIGFTVLTLLDAIRAFRRRAL